MLTQQTISEIIGRFTSEIMQAINVANTASSNASNEMVRYEPIVAVVRNTSQTETALPFEVMSNSVLSFEVEQGGDLQVSKPTAEQSRVFEDIFGLSADILHEAGLRRICYIPEEGENLGQFSDGEFITLPDALPTKATYDTPGHQWEEFSFGYLPSIPCGESFRFPVHNKAGEKVGYTYHRFKSYDFETSPEIVTYLRVQGQTSSHFLAVQRAAFGRSRRAIGFR